MISGPIREDLNSFFWRQVVANSPDAAKPSQDYEQGWNAVNELIRSDYTWSGYERNVFYANNRDGTFSDVSGAVGLDFLEDGRAFALADFDHDGRQEVFLKNRNGPQLRLLKNVVRGASALHRIPAARREEQSRRDRRGHHGRNRTGRRREAASRFGISFAAQQRSLLRLRRRKGPGESFHPLAERPGAGASRSADQSQNHGWKKARSRRESNPSCPSFPDHPEPNRDRKGASANPRHQKPGS